MNAVRTAKEVKRALPFVLLLGLLPLAKKLSTPEPRPAASFPEIPALATQTALDQRVRINGEPVLFGTRRNGTLEQVRAECEAGDLGVHPPVTAGETTLTTDRLKRIEAKSSHALLCIFEHGIRYSEVRDSGTMFTVASESRPELDFDLTKDVPGGDLPGVARPKESIRRFAGEVDNSEVRIYESPSSPVEYDAAMRLFGWKSSPEVAKELPNARSYERDGAELVVVFDHGLVTIAGARRHH
jgi:hypothetical protein